jgi:8-oxo-dGTP diphosphatase
MEDHWFMFFEDPWFYVHRSWTGFCIYAVRFDLLGDSGARIAEVQVNRDARQYGSTDDVEDILLLTVLLDDRAGRATEAAWKAYLRHPRKTRDDRRKPRS